MVLLLAASPGPQGQLAAQDRPQVETTLVEGTDNGYIYRNGGRQSMFIVTEDGVIATDPAGYGVANAGETYLSEIRSVTSSRSDI